MKGGLMGALLIMIVAFVGYIIMYKLYGKFIGRKIFAISGEAKAPSVEFEDGKDYVPTRKEVIFGHHFTSIAGTGPIVGPAIAIIWGWVPAMLWIFIGTVVMGAVHDFGTLIVSMRNQGKSIAEFTGKYINDRTRIFFFLIIFLLLWIVIAIFGLIIALVFAWYPASVIPVWLEVAIAVYLGHLIYKKGFNITTWSIIAVAVMYATFIIGYYVPVKMPAIWGIPATGVWVIILLVYAFIASVLPVTTLLQPRDFINSHQLLVALVLLVIGVFIAAFAGNLQIVAPAVQASPAKAPPLWPFLFITIACGAISGFHSLVIAVAAGIGMGYVTKAGETLTGITAWTTHYASWTAAAGLGSKVAAVVDGSANIIGALGIPKGVGLVIMGVFVASFAGTTLDTATRIQRYVLSELFGGLKLTALTGKYVATGIAVVSAGILAFVTGGGGKGALVLWPLFGATNQTIAALALITITLYLHTKGGAKWMIAGVPAIFMAVMTIWATVYNQVNFLGAHNMLLTIINICILIVAVWIVIEGVVKFFTPTGPPAAEAEAAAS